VPQCFFLSDSSIRDWSQSWQTCAVNEPGLISKSSKIFRKQMSLSLNFRTAKYVHRATVSCYTYVVLGQRSQIRPFRHSLTFCVIPWVHFWSNWVWFMKIGLISLIMHSGTPFLCLYDSSCLLYLHQLTLPFGQRWCWGFKSVEATWYKLAYIVDPVICTAFQKSAKH
jgi:hypothetical protein